MPPDAPSADAPSCSSERRRSLGQEHVKCSRGSSRGSEIVAAERQENGIDENTSYLVNRVVVAAWGARGHDAPT